MIGICIASGALGFFLLGMWVAAWALREDAPQSAQVATPAQRRSASRRGGK